MDVVREKPKVLELCAGAGGQASGLKLAGFEAVSLVELDSWACRTLRTNFPAETVLEVDVREVRGRDFMDIDLLAGGVPCPPFSVAGKQLGSNDERDLVPEVLRLVKEARPRAVMLENVPGLMMSRFAPYRARINRVIESLGYRPHWQILNACDYRVSQLRPRTVMVSLRADDATFFRWPLSSGTPAPHVGELLFPLISSRGWEGANEWAERAKGIAPTLVGGSKKHGGPDLGPTRARQAWLRLGVDGRGLADEPPGPGFVGMPRLTVPMTALIQGFDPKWRFEGGKTAAYRQVGNAFPPPVARAVGKAILRAWQRHVGEEPGQQSLAV